ncbi:hypothetical protein [Streptomyces sp. NPDC005283]|uniref:hypothetical protein n=1 Tax=Streptomyces sp. NPDC005283 TaxID=3156871 RepID=UPI0034539754
MNIEHWLAKAAEYRETDGGHMYESLAVAMTLELGYETAAAFTKELSAVVDGWSTGGSHAAAQLYEFLGWPQSALLVAWFNNLENYRMVRDGVLTPTSPAPRAVLP